MTAQPEVQIYRSELDAMAAHMARFGHLETGGSLFGFVTRSGTQVVVLATGPGADARHNSTSFFQDAAWMEETHRELWSGHGLQHIGEWHSHHHIALAEPSGGDEATVWGALSNLGWPQFLLGIGNYPDPDERSCTFGLFLFDAVRSRMTAVPVRVLDGVSPIRVAATARITARPKFTPSWSVRAPGFPTWSTTFGMEIRLKRELRALAALDQLCGIRADMRSDGEHLVVELSGAREGRITLGEGFPHVAPQTSEAFPSVPWSAERLVAQWVVEGMAAAAEARVARDFGKRWAARIRSRRSIQGETS